MNSLAGEDILPSPPFEYASTRRTYIFPGCSPPIVVSNFLEPIGMYVSLAVAMSWSASQILT